MNFQALNLQQFCQTGNNFTHIFYSYTCSPPFWPRVKSIYVGTHTTDGSMNAVNCGGFTVAQMVEHSTRNCKDPPFLLFLRNRLQLFQDSFSIFSSLIRLFTFSSIQRIFLFLYKDHATASIKTDARVSDHKTRSVKPL